MGADARELPVVVRDALKRAAIPESAMGLFVQDVNDKRALVQFNANTPLSPASIMKLVTTNAALEMLGPNYTWKTRAYSTGVQNGDVLDGDLIIKGSGDPKLVIENFWLFLRQIRAQGIRDIRGNVLLDRGVFEEIPFDPGKFDGDTLKPYNAGPDALLLNYNAFRFQFTPIQSTGQVKISIDPPVVGYTAVAPSLSNAECGDWQKKLNVVFSQNGVRFNGNFAASCGEKTWYLHPDQLTSMQYFAVVFRKMWSDIGGTFKGDVRTGALTTDARFVTEWESVTLPEVIRDINKYSNNVMARQVLLSLAAQGTTAPANHFRGAQIIKTWLEEKGISAPELVIENGSGLSRSERIAPRTMGQMLISAYQSPLMPEFMSSMPLVGFDGTMRRRLTSASIAGKAHIKTGRIDQVRSIAGYVFAASGKRYAVVCIVNHPNADASQAAQDAMLQWVYEQ